MEYFCKNNQQQKKTLINSKKIAYSAIVLVTSMVIVFSFANKCVESTNLDGLKRFCKCFSIYDNVASMYDTSTSPNAINSINGIR